MAAHNPDSPNDVAWHAEQNAARDAVLAARIRTGDVEAFTGLFRAYFVALVRFVMRLLHSREASEDIVQDVFARLWERRHRIDPARSIRSYLYASARNLAFNTLAHDEIVRRHAAGQDTQREGMPDASASEPADQVVLAEELSRVAAERVALLSPRLREIYHLSRHDGMTPKEIAETLGVAVGTVHVQLARIVKALYPALERWVQG